MSKVTYGFTVKNRAKLLLEILLDFVENEPVPRERGMIIWKWKKENSFRPELVVSSKLRHLANLANKDIYKGDLNVLQVRQALLEHLKNFLEILEDNRVNKQGSDNWHFTLKLWSKNKETNLKKFDEEWEKKRNNSLKKSKNFFIPHDFKDRYTEKYQSYCDLIKVLGMSQSVSLNSVYTTLKLHKPEYLKQLKSIEDLEETYRNNRSRSFKLKEYPKMPDIDAANNYQYLMVLGNPGMGKSIFLRKVGLEALKGKNEKYRHDCIPVLIELKKFQTGEINLQAEIIKEFKNCGLQNPENFVVKCLEHGNLLVLLDGLDELPKERISLVCNAIQNFVNSYRKNRFISSCRIAAYRHNFSGFTDMVIAELTDEQIKNFIDNWFGKSSQSEKCWNELNNNKQIAAKDLAQNPLLLTLICLLYQRSGQFPTNRATLYEKALRVLLEEWNAEKEIPNYPEQLYKGLDTKRKEIILSEFAYNSFCEDYIFFNEREISASIEKILKEMLSSEQFIDGRIVLKDIEQQHGLLVERAESIYSFSHLTIQEFLTALNVYDDDEKIRDLVEKHLYDTRWREIFLLIAGLKNKADKMLLTIEEKINKDASIPLLKSFLVWVEKVTNTSNGNIKNVAKRSNILANALANAYANNYAYVYSLPNKLRHAYALAYLNNFKKEDSLYNAYSLASLYIGFYSNTYANVNLLTYAYALAKSFSSTMGHLYDRENINVYNNAIDEFIAYANQLKIPKIFENVNFTLLVARLKKLKNMIPNKHESQLVHQEFSRKIINTWLDSFYLTSDLVNLSKKEFDAIDEQYLYANLLMVECRQASVRVTSRTWKEIESRMLLPPKQDCI